MGVIIKRLPWVLVGTYYLLASAGLYLLHLAGATFADMGIPNLALVGFYYFLGLWVIIGALVAVRRPEHPVGWIVSVGLIAPAIDVLAAGLVSYPLNTAVEMPSLVALSLIWLNWSGMPFGILIFALVFLLTPDGQFLSRGWRMVGWTTVVAFLAYLTVKVFEPGPLVIMPALENPSPARPSVWRTLGPLMWGSLLLLVLCYLGGFASLLQRYRRAGEDERRQVRWLIPPAVLFFLGIPLNLVGEHGPWPEIFSLGSAFHMLAVIGMVASVAFAVLRYHLYDLEIILNRTLVYGSLTTALAILYFATVGLLQRIFPSQSQAAVVISTLAIAALFAPLRRRIQGAIDRRFFRRRYNATQILASFGRTVRIQVDLDALTHSLLDLVQTTMEPRSASLWLRRSIRGE